MKKFKNIKIMPEEYQSLMLKLIDFNKLIKDQRKIIKK